jgi:lipoyl(octanoyl) transferase
MKCLYTMSKAKVKFQKIENKSYQEVWDFQKELLAALVAKKMSLRALTEEEKLAHRQEHHILFCEHSPVYTLGKSGKIDHLLLDEEELNKNAIEFFKINRGGDITYHGPGQITGYLIFDLEEFFRDVHRFVRTIEKAVIKTLEEYNIEATRIPEYTGVWIKAKNAGEQDRKICAIGVHLSRWVTMHGFAFNINTDLQYYQNIVPCGISAQEKQVTSMEKELKRKLDMDEVAAILKHNFAAEFGFDYVE